MTKKEKDYVNNVRETISAYIRETETPQNTIAKEIGISAAALSQFLSGNYTGDNKSLADDLESYLEIASDRTKMRDATVFYPGLYNTDVVLHAAWYAHTYCDMVLIRGDSGAGKTVALRYYADKHAGVIFVTANSSVRSQFQIIKAIAAAMGNNYGGGSFKTVMDRLIKTLDGSKRLIIVDEADRLSLQALQAVRDLHDIAHVGIVLSGNNKLYTQMTNGARGGEFDQIRTRIPLKPWVYNEYELDEIKAIFPGVSDDVARVLLEKAEKCSLREAVKLFSYAVFVTDSTNETISAETVRDYCEGFE